MEKTDTRTGAAWGILFGGLAVFVAVPALLLATGYDTIKPSADSAAELSLAGALIPALAGILLIRGIPLHAPRLLPRVPDRRALSRQATALALIAFLWPLALFLVSEMGQHALVRDIWALAKPLVFLVLPLVLLRTLRPREEPDPFRLTWLPRQAWQWLAPIPAVLVFGWLYILGPFSPPLPSADDYPDPVYLAVGATLTFFTANVLEEVFFRGMLQTRSKRFSGAGPESCSRHCCSRGCTCRRTARERFRSPSARSWPSKGSSACSPATCGRATATCGRRSPRTPR